MRISDYITPQLLQEIQDNFSDATGLASIAVDNDGKYITKGSNFTDFCMKYTRNTKEGLRRCVKCDNECTGTYFCHAGLMDFSIDIKINNEKVGKIIGGQVLPKEPDEEEFRKVARDLGIDENKYIEALRKVPIRPEKSIRSAAQLLGHVINILLNIEYNKIQSDETLNTLNEQIDISSKLIKNINSQSRELDNVEMSQKMLAVNASIEAAHVGEAGKGFAIVAANVSDLAVISGKINSDIKNTLEKLTLSINKMSEASKKVNIK